MWLTIKKYAFRFINKCLCISDMITIFNTKVFKLTICSQLFKNILFNLNFVLYQKLSNFLYQVNYKHSK